MLEPNTQSVFAQVSSMNGVLTVRLAGPSVGQREVPIITDLVVPAIDEAVAKRSLRFLVLDLSDVTFVNSMGLGMFIDFRNRAAKAGGTAALVGMNQQLTDLFKMVKIEKLYTIAKDGAELNKIIAS